MSITTYMAGEVLFLKHSDQREKWLIRTSKFRNDGIILPAEKVNIPKSDKDFVRIAMDFQFWVNQNLKS